MTAQKGSGMGSVVRKVFLVTLAAVLLVGFVAAFASAGGKPTFTFVSPSPSEGATLTSSSVSLAFTYNRTPKQVKALTCTLSGPSSSSGACDAVVASGSGSQSGKSYSGLANGSYTVTGSDGGSASGVRPV